MPQDQALRSRNIINSAVRIIIVADLLLLTAYLSHHLAGSPGGTFGLQLVDLNGEDSVAAWFSSVKLAAVSVFLIIAGFAVKYRWPRQGAAGLLMLGVLFMLMSIDEEVMLHESIGWHSDQLLPGGDRDSTWFSTTGIWMILIGPPAIGLFMWCVWRSRQVWARVPGVKTRIVAGLVVFFAGAVGVELLSNIWDAGSMLVVQAMLEEGCEMLGVSLVLWGTIDLSLSTLMPGRVAQADRVPESRALQRA